MKKFILSSTVLSLCLLTWTLTEWLTPNHCINSTFVKNFSVIDHPQAGAVDISECGFSVALNGRIQLSYLPEFKRLFTAIRRVESLAHLLPEPPAKIRVVVRYDAPFTWDFRNGRLLLGSELFTVPSQLEYSLIQALVETSAPHLDSEVFLKEVLQEFLWFYAMGDSSAPHYSDGVLSDWSRLDFPQTLMNLADYCQSRLVPIQQLQSCLQINSDGVAESSNTATHWPLRRLIAAGLWKYYDSAHILTKWQMIDGFRQLELEQKWTELQLDLPPSLHPNELRRWTAHFLRNLSVGLAQGRWSEDGFHELIARMGLTEKSSPPVALVAGKEISWDRLTNEWTEAQLADAPRPIAIKKEQHITYVPSLTGVRQWQLEKLQARQVLLLSCELPLLQDLLDMGDQVKKVTFVERCSDEPNISWSPFLAGDMRSFLGINSRLRFLHFHLPSLSFANETGRLDERWRQPDWKNGFRWDERLRAYRSIAPIEGVTMGRPAENSL